MQIPTWLILTKDWLEIVMAICVCIGFIFLTPLKNAFGSMFKKHIVEPENKQNEEIGKLGKKLDELSDNVDQLTVNVESARGIYKALLHHEIFITAKAAIERGEISMMELQNLDELYKAYHDNLGGNGTAEKLYQEAKELKIKE